MTDQERVQGFLTAYQQIVRLYGVDWVAQLEPENYGSMVQVKAKIAPGLVPDWTLPKMEAKGINELPLVQPIPLTLEHPELVMQDNGHES